MRTATWRFTAWVAMNKTTERVDWSSTAATELYDLTADTGRDCDFEGSGNCNVDIIWGHPSRGSSRRFAVLLWPSDHAWWPCSVEAHRCLIRIYVFLFFWGVLGTPTLRPNWGFRYSKNVAADPAHASEVRTLISDLHAEVDTWY